ncbi:MAG: hypothetical protein TQ37_05405 [Candidatus Synechococcus spongiarum 15L]|uniref:Uncharacterized protein n=2 Tax=Candidatus Synechococcus spongiarum TaxID=431041 RepID=A0A1T1C7Y8_9SYNE|nr:MAG: hypothetical protein TQ37_05405 [Candidatus Synechococcus spongiarum 15L]OOV24633.1 hypothetical protein BV61_07475 [Candidatus Synechococcus spongiarum LMB bulk15M]
MGLAVLKKPKAAGPSLEGPSLARDGPFPFGQRIQGSAPVVLKPEIRFTGFLQCTSLTKPFFCDLWRLPQAWCDLVVQTRSWIRLQPSSQASNDSLLAAVVCVMA